MHRTQRDGRFHVPKHGPSSLDASIGVDHRVALVGVREQPVVDAFEPGEDVPVGDPAPEVGFDPTEEPLAGDPGLGVERRLPLRFAHPGHVARAERIEVVALGDLLSELLVGVGGTNVGLVRVVGPVR